MLYATTMSVIEYFDDAVRLRGFMGENVRKSWCHRHPTTSNICAPEQAPNEKSDQKSGPYYSIMIAVQHATGFMF